MLKNIDELFMELGENARQLECGNAVLGKTIHYEARFVKVDFVCEGVDDDYYLLSKDDAFPPEECWTEV